MLKGGRTGFLALLSRNKLEALSPDPLCQRPVWREEPYAGVQAAVLPEVSQLSSPGLTFQLYMGVSQLPYVLGWWMERSGSYT